MNFFKEIILGDSNSTPIYLYIEIQTSVTFYVSTTQVQGVVYLDYFEHHDDEYNINVYLSDGRCSANDRMNFAFNGFRLLCYEESLAHLPMGPIIAYGRLCSQNWTDFSKTCFLEFSIDTTILSDLITPILGKAHYWDHEEFWVFRGSDGPMPFGISDDLVTMLVAGQGNPISLILSMVNKPGISFNTDLWSLVATSTLLTLAHSSHPKSLTTFYIIFDQHMVAMKRQLSAMYKLGYDFRPFWRKADRPITSWFGAKVKPRDFVLNNAPRGTLYFSDLTFMQIGLSEHHIATIEVIGGWSDDPSQHNYAPSHN